MFIFAVFLLNFFGKIYFSLFLLLAALAAVVVFITFLAEPSILVEIFTLLIFFNSHLFHNFNSFTRHSIYRRRRNWRSLFRYRLLKVQWGLFKLVNFSVLIIFWTFVFVNISVTKNCFVGVDKSFIIFGAIGPLFCFLAFLTANKIQNCFLFECGSCLFCCRFLKTAMNKYNDLNENLFLF